MRWLWLVVLPLPLLAWEFSGSLKNYARHEKANGFGTSNASWESVLRGVAKHRVNEDTYFEAAYEVAPAFRKRSLQGASPFSVPPASPYRIEDLSREVFDTQDDFFLLQNLDRLFFTRESEAFDLRVGRQPISFGVARVINPVDIIVPFRFDTLDQEERVGVDAVRVLVPTGDLSAFDAGLIFGPDFRYDRSAGYLSYRFNVSETDIVTTLIHFRRNTLLGFSVERAVWDAGWWFEASHVWAQALMPGIRGENYLRFSTGLDYNVRENVYVFIEFHYNGAGTSTRMNYATNVLQAAYTQGSVYLLGKRYLIPGTTVEVNPLLHWTSQMMLNLDDPSAYVLNQLEYSLSEDVYFDLGAYLGLGESSTGSEFRLYPDLYYLALRWYF